jgi:hypothetical protein
MMWQDNGNPTATSFSKTGPDPLEHLLAPLLHPDLHILPLNDSHSNGVLENRKALKWSIKT